MDTPPQTGSGNGLRGGTPTNTWGGGGGENKKQKAEGEEIEPLSSRTKPS